MPGAYSTLMATILFRRAIQTESLSKYSEHNTGAAELGGRRHISGTSVRIMNMRSEEVSHMRACFRPHH